MKKILNKKIVAKIFLILTFINIIGLTNVNARDIDKSEPIINARHAVVLERNTGMILFGKNENEKCKMASTTKIMTSIVVIENVKNLEEKVIVSKKAAATGGSRLGLSANSEITINDLLYGLMMVSRE